MFLIHATLDGHQPPWEYLPSSAMQPKLGMALKLTDGKLALCSGTTKPEFVSMYDAPATLAAGDIIPVIRVTPDIIFETVASASLSSAAVGAKVTIASDGLRVTGTTTSGVATIVEKEADASGSTVRVTF